MPVSSVIVLRPICQTWHQCLCQISVHNSFNRHFLLSTVTEENWKTVSQSVVTKPDILPERGLFAVANAYSCDGLV
jgi:hypothetical protein